MSPLQVKEKLRVCASRPGANSANITIEIMITTVVPFMEFRDFRMHSIVTQGFARRNDAPIVRAVHRHKRRLGRKVNLIQQSQTRGLSGRLTSRESAAPICREARPLGILTFF